MECAAPRARRIPGPHVPFPPCAPAPHRHRPEPINFASNWRSRPTTIELIHGDLLPRRGLPIARDLIANHRVKNMRIHVAHVDG